MPLINNVNMLNDKIEVFTREYISDDYGNQIESLVKVGECWCTVRTQTIQEVQETRRVSQDIEVQFLVRHYLPFVIKSSMIIHWKDRKYNVSQVNIDTQYKEWDVVFAKLEKNS